MLLINSIMITVFPTPAPPKRPILPPLAYGVSKSTTLMPGTRISDSVDWSTNSGADAWIGRRRSVSIGPRSSIGSPMTFIIRPKVSRPTGTEIGCPVSLTSAPLTKPSVESIAIVRTVASPRCWATSSINRSPWFSHSSALRIGGRWSPNWTSTTAPITWVICPTDLAMFTTPCATFKALQRQRLFRLVPWLS